ncbi:FMN-binding negative transcriptional regulator [Shewanella sp. GXUN23E]|uniref:FMN-binding negative transcriptional regulator n=1 Tax=Shewanella sp. GXUN23E TaxID=3422498 RepID=UPI003D7C7D5C
MYIPGKLRMPPERVGAFIKQYGFATLITPSLEAAHLPLTLHVDERGRRWLQGHMAKANHLWREIEGQRVLAIFSGPHAYISPHWYASAPAVPTWNYAAVHCYGRLELLDDCQLPQSMDALIAEYEPQLLTDKQMMPAQYRQKLAAAVVGFQIEIDDIQAKEKLGQHRSCDDQRGVTAALTGSNGLEAKLLLEYMLKHQLGVG